MISFPHLDFCFLIFAFHIAILMPLTYFLLGSQLFEVFYFLIFLVLLFPFQNFLCLAILFGELYFYFVVFLANFAALSFKYLAGQRERTVVKMFALHMATWV